MRSFGLFLFFFYNCNTIIKSYKHIQPRPEGTFHANLGESEIARLNENSIQERIWALMWSMWTVLLSEENMLWMISLSCPAWGFPLTFDWPLWRARCREDCPLLRDCLVLPPPLPPPQPWDGFTKHSFHWKQIGVYSNVQLNTFFFWEGKCAEGSSVLCSWADTIHKGTRFFLNMKEWRIKRIKIKRELFSCCNLMLILEPLFTLQWFKRYLRLFSFSPCSLVLLFFLLAPFFVHICFLSLLLSF